METFLIGVGRVNFTNSHSVANSGIQNYESVVRVYFDVKWLEGDRGTHIKHHSSFFLSGVSKIAMWKLFVGAREEKCVSCTHSMSEA